MKKGQILVEIIIGVGVIAFVLAGVIPLFLIGIRGGSESWRTDSARLLAAEAMAATQTLARQNWNNLYRPLGTSNKGADNPYHVVASDSWSLAAGDETIILNNLTFSRQIMIENVSRTGKNGAGELEETYNAIRDDPSTQKITVKVTWPGSSGIELINYLGRWQNSLWQPTDWSNSSSYSELSKNFKASGDIDTTIAGSLRLAKIPVAGNAKFGNQFVASSTTFIYSLNNPNRRLSMRFTAEQGGNVNQIRFYIDSQKSGGQINYLYGIQADDGSANHNPSGTFLASNTASFGSTGWQTVNLTNPGALVAGNVYHLVVQWSGSGQQPANNRYINIRSSLPDNLLVPQNSHKDSSANTLRFDGTNWSLANQQPIYVLGYAGGSFEGNPYDSRASRNIYGSRFEGETFTLSNQRQVAGIGLYVALSAANLPNDSLYVTLVDLTTGDSKSSTFIDVATTTLDTNYTWVEHNFSSPITSVAETIR